MDVDADLEERSRDLSGVCVDKLAEQHLGADRDYLSARHGRLV